MTSDPPGATAAESHPPSGRTVDDFEALYTAWFHKCCGWLQAMGVPDAEVEDVAQDTFIEVQRALQSFRGDNLAGWLYGVARNVASSHRRTRWFRQVFRQRQDVDDQWIDPTDGPAERYQQRQAQLLVRRILDDMSPKLRTAFHLFEILGYSGEEIAALEGVSPATVRSRLRLARAQFASATERLLGPPGKG